MDRGRLQPGNYVLGMEFVKENVGQYHEALGTAKLYVNDQVVAQGRCARSDLDLEREAAAMMARE